MSRSCDRGPAPITSVPPTTTAWCAPSRRSSSAASLGRASWPVRMIGCPSELAAIMSGHASPDATTTLADEDQPCDTAMAVAYWSASASR